MTAPTWTLAAVCAALACGWWLTWREWRGRVDAALSDVRNAQAQWECDGLTIKQLRASEADARDLQAAIVKRESGRCDCSCADPCPLGRVGSLSRCTIADFTEALEAERDAHRATQVERDEANDRAAELLGTATFERDAWRYELETEQEAHRATGAELRRVKGACAALRDRVVTRDGRGRFRKGVGE